MTDYNGGWHELLVALRSLFVRDVCDVTFNLGERTGSWTSCGGLHRGVQNKVARLPLARHVLPMRNQHGKSIRFAGDGGPSLLRCQGFPQLLDDGWGQKEPRDSLEKGSILLLQHGAGSSNTRLASNHPLIDKYAGSTSDQNFPRVLLRLSITPFF